MMNFCSLDVKQQPINESFILKRRDQIKCIRRVSAISFVSRKTGKPNNKK